MTIKEIAKLCGVSRGTVDRVLNNRGRVKPETEARVRSAIASLGYTKNIAGRALTVRRSAPVIGAILCSEGNPFFNDVIAGLKKGESELHDYGVSVLLRTIRGYGVDRQLALIDELEGSISALIIQPINDPRIEERLCAIRGEGVPVIAVNTDIAARSRCRYVGSDYLSGGETAAGLMRLATDGKARVGVIAGVSTLMGHELRLKGFERRWLELCPQSPIMDMESGNDDPELSYKATLKLLGRTPDIDALFVVAAGAERVCRALDDAGRAEDMRVIAYDDVPSTREMMRRGVVRAVVCQQPVEQGYRAVRAAFDAILLGDKQNSDSIIMDNQIKITENL